MEHQKSYAEYIDEFRSDEIYDGLMRGLFPEKLPPVFTAEGFLAYTKQAFRQEFKVCDKWRHYVRFESMRNLNRPRLMGIADPFGYENLCRCIKECWDKIQDYFRKVTVDQEYKISRLHVRKMSGTSSIFKMNYHAKSWNQDPVPDLRIGARYLIRADISSCFPSIYTHSLPWALVGKDVSKDHTKDDVWYNNIDKCASHLRDGETTGLMIGNHASNILSEIVLAKVDEKLWKNHGRYKYIRNIDDYECYADTRENAERFLIDLKDALYEYNLRINYEKTKIVELPVEYDDSWVRKINSQLSLLPEGVLAKKHVEAFVGVIVEQLRETNNASVVYYAMKAFKHRVLNEGARLYYLKYMAHLAVLYPYLYGCFDECLFYPFDVRYSAIADMSDRMLKHSLEVKNYEEGAFAFYFAVKYGFNIQGFNVDAIINTHDAILCAMALLYVRRRGLPNDEARLCKHAEKYIATRNEFEEQWIFAYEALPAEKLAGKWKDLKTAHVSFVKNLEELAPDCFPEYESERIDWSAHVENMDEIVGLQGIKRRYMTDLPSHFDPVVAEKYLNRVVTNLWHKALIRKVVRIPMDRARYYYYEILELEEPDVKISLLRHTLKWLRQNRYVGLRFGIQGESVSCYWPREKLMQALDALTLDKVVFSGKHFSPIVLKDKQKNIYRHLQLPQEIEYERDQLEAINALLEQHDFSCRLNLRSKMDSFYPRLKAVFNNSSWQEGGRLYASGSKNGIDYQCIPSDMRPSITIDGKPTVEMDYSGLHVNMLYAMEGAQLVEDAYAFLPSDQRALAKFAMLVVLNAEDERQGINALLSRRKELLYATGLSQKKESLRKAFILNDNMEEVVDKAKAAHPKISKYFFKQFALQLQNRDSKMALSVLTHFQRRGIPVLPVHDSFIIEKEKDAELKDVMEKVYSKFNGEFSCVVKNGNS